MTLTEMLDHRLDLLKKLKANLEETINLNLVLNIYDGSVYAELEEVALAIEQSENF